MSDFVYGYITVERRGEQFEVCVTDIGDDRCVLFDRYHDARAWAGGRYAQGYVMSIKDKVAEAIHEEQVAEKRAAIEEHGAWAGVSRA